MAVVRIPSQGPFLTEWLAHEGKSDAWLAEQLGIDRSTVGKWQKEKQRFDPVKQKKVADTLQIHPALLWLDPRERATQLLRAFLAGEGPTDLSRIHV